MNATVVDRPVPTTAPGADAGPRARRAPWSRAPVVAVVLLAGWLLVSLLLGDGYLSPDTGAKVATHEAMLRRGDLAPDLGWWAAAHDPDASLHPYMGVRVVGARSVAVTTLPMLYLSHPLYLVGGHHAALLVPMLGGVAAAFAGGALARRLGASSGVATATIWITGLAGPVSVYALSLWEHTAGLALMAWGAVWAVDASRQPATWTPALWAGMAYGAAATMRQEAIVYGFVAGCLVVATAAVARRVRPVAGAALAFGAGVALPTLANVVLEVAMVGAPLRTGRSADTLAMAGAQVGARFEAALVTFAAPVSTGDGLGLLLAVTTLVGLVALVRGILAGRPVRLAVVAVTAVVVISAVFQIQAGPAFVPGLVAASPLAGAGLALALSRSSWRPPAVAATLALGLVPLPLVWVVQFATEGAWPQWGGRYVLLTGFLLSVVAVVVLAEGHRRLLNGLVAASVAVTAVGAATVVARSHEYERLAASLVARPEPVLVFHDGFLVQEAGPAGLDARWLGARTEAQRLEAAALLRTLDVDRFGYLGPGEVAPEFPGYAPVGAGWVGEEGGRRERVTTFAADGATGG